MAKETVNNIYPIVQVDSEQKQYLKLKFVILEKDWPYPNFEMYVQHNDPMLFIKKELQERHGSIKDIQLYLDGERQNNIPYVFNKTIGEALNMKGADKMGEAPQVTITYLVYGDSGAGKSSFIKSLNGVTKEGLIPETGGKGYSCTQNPGLIYIVNDDPILGNMQLIDTRGTWDPSQADNVSILNDLVKVLMDYSVEGMQKNLNPIQRIDGVIYIHTALSYDRYSRNVRIAHLSSLVGVNLDASSVTLMTHCHSIQKLGKENEKFNLMLKAHHKDDREYVLWDSEDALDDQKLNLKQRLFNLEPFSLKNMEESNQDIIIIAKEMQQRDLVQTLVTKYNKVIKNKIIHQAQEQWSDKEITLWMECPNSYTKSLLTKFTSKLDTLYSKIYQQNYQIEPFPEKALNPKMILEFKIVKKELQNAEIIEEPIFNNKGDKYEIQLKYKWKALQDSNSPGQIQLKIAARLKFKMEFQVSVEEVEEVKTLEMLPRYSDEKPYLMEAQKQQLDSLINTIKQKLN